MPFDVRVRKVGDLAKIEVVELDNSGEPKSGRSWYCNIAVDGIDLDAEPIELPDSIMAPALDNLRAQRQATLAQEEADAALEKAAVAWLDGKLPE